MDFDVRFEKSGHRRMLLSLNQKEGLGQTVKRWMSGGSTIIGLPYDPSAQPPAADATAKCGSA